MLTIIVTHLHTSISQLMFIFLGGGIAELVSCLPLTLGTGVQILEEV